MSRPPADKFTFVGEDVWLSEFRLAPTHPDWNLTRRTTDVAFLFAFPRTTVAIRHERRREVVADATSVVVYGPGQAYRRRLISRVGDECTVVAASRPLVAQIIERTGGSGDAASDRIPFSATDVGRDAHLTLERLRRHVSAVQPARTDAVLEELYWLVSHVISNGYGARSSPVDGPTARAHRDLVHAVRDAIGRDLTNAQSLDDLARELWVSPFHLARVFRSTTGRPIHAYRTELRLRTSLPMIARGERLADVAQQVGFASHAHLTDRFVRAYGMTPVRWRETSKNMEAGAEDSFIA